MPDDVIIKFFREDLTEAEEQALSERLLSSVEDAVRFGQHAEASYRHYGLPEPQWRGGGPPMGFLSKARFRFGPWMALALLAGFSAWGIWNYWRGTERKMEVSVPSTLSTVPGASTLSEQKSKAVHSEEPIIPDQLSPAPVIPNPVDAGASAHRSHPNLEVLVNQKRSAAVTVRVVGPDGTQAVMLYQGVLQPGSWTFDWNGRLADGAAPPAGAYQIQVVSGAVTLNKSVVIRK